MMYSKMFRRIKSHVYFVRTFKNFGHKRQPEAGITVLWQGFLTFSFMGICLDWKRIKGFFSVEPTSDSDTKTPPLDI